jgi:hypothetical protein
LELFALDGDLSGLAVLVDEGAGLFGDGEGGVDGGAEIVGVSALDGSNRFEDVVMMLQESFKDCLSDVVVSGLGGEDCGDDDDLRHGEKK